MFSRVLLHRHSSFSPWKWSPTQCFVDGLIAECIIVSSSLPVSGTSTSDDFHVQSDVFPQKKVKRDISSVGRRFRPWIGSLGSLSDHSRTSTSKGFGMLPYELDAGGITPLAGDVGCSRST